MAHNFRRLEYVYLEYDYSEPFGHMMPLLTLLQLDRRRGHVVGGRLDELVKQLGVDQTASSPSHLATRILTATPCMSCFRGIDIAGKFQL